MVERLIRTVAVLSIALVLGRALIGMLVDVVGSADSGVASGIGRTGSFLGSVLILLLALVLVVGVVIRGRDAIARLHGRGRHGGDPGARYSRRHSVTGDPPASVGRGDLPHRRGRRREVD